MSKKRRKNNMIFPNAPNQLHAKTRWSAKITSLWLAHDKCNAFTKINKSQHRLLIAKDGSLSPH
jgi:hypothetical protein